MPALARILRQFGMFFGVGIAAAIVHYGLLVALVEGAGLEPVPATLAGYVAGGLVSYVLNTLGVQREPGVPGFDG